MPPQPEVLPHRYIFRVFDTKRAKLLSLSHLAPAAVAPVVAAAAMATTLAGFQISGTGAAVPKGATSRGAIRSSSSALCFPWRSSVAGRAAHLRAVRSGPATPADLSKKVEESIQKAQETCAGDPASGECVAAWDEVEELSSTASHARDKAKGNSDPLENYCKDNPETDECRTYDT